MRYRPRPRPPRARVVRAAGAVVWRLREHKKPPVPGPLMARGRPLTARDIEVLLVHRPRYGDWSWPKGKAERGEHILAAAVREVEEETGCVVRLGAPLTSQRYRLGREGHTKEVKYWVGTLDLASAPLRVRPPVEKASLREIDESRWIRPDKARQMLSRKGDRRLLDDLLVRLEDNTLNTSTLTILRHAKAQARCNWDGVEAMRTLNRIGVEQAQAIPSLLSAYGISRVVTSPWRRCLATVGCFASLSGAEVQMSPVLTEDAYAARPGETRKVLTDLLTDLQEPTVVCVHRPILPGFVGEIALRTPNSITYMLPQSDPYLRSAEMLVLHIAEEDKSSGSNKPTVVAIEKHRALSLA